MGAGKSTKPILHGSLFRGKDEIAFRQPLYAADVLELQQGGLSSDTLHVPKALGYPFAVRIETSKRQHSNGRDPELGTPLRFANGILL